MGEASRLHCNEGPHNEALSWFWLCQFLQAVWGGFYWVKYLAFILVCNSADFGYFLPIYWLERFFKVDTAMANRPHVIDGKTVDPKRAVPRDQSQRSETNLSTKRLYISGVREEHTEEMFEEYFSQFGKVVKVWEK